MGKIKLPDPEPEKIVRAQGENLTISVSEEEKNYRSKNGPDDVNDILKDKLKCTVCMKTVSDIVKKSTEPFVHMVLGVLMCKECSSFYGDGYFSVDEDGDDKYCRWCGQGGTLYLCSKCSCAFCKKCIKQNLSRQDVKDLESDDWKCLICNPKPLYECRTICWALQEYAQAKKNSQNSDEEDEKPKPSSSKSKNSKKSPRSEPRSSTSKKRKASEIEEESETEKERESKRRKSSGRDPPSSTSRRSRSKAVPSKEIIEDESEEEDIKPVERKSRKTKNKKDESDDEDSKHIASKSKKSKNSEADIQLPKRPTRSPQKKVKVNLSDDDDDDDDEEEVVDEEEAEKDEEDIDYGKSSSKRSLSKSPKKEKSKSGSSKNDGKKEKTKRSSSKKEKEIPKSAKKSSRHSNDKKVKEVDDDEITDIPVKRSQRSTKGRNLYADDSDSASKEDKFETKSKTSVRKSVEEAPRKTLTIPKNAKKEVVEAGGFINSALKDVVELSNLIFIRCEKLCCKSVQSTEDVLHVFSKLKQLTDAVHQNLNLIEKGLDTKITAWKSENVECKDEDNKNDEKGKEEEVQEEPDSNFDEGKATQESKIKGNGEEMEIEEKVDQDQKDHTETMDVDEENLITAQSDSCNTKETDEKPIDSIGQASTEENDVEKPTESEEINTKKQTEEKNEMDNVLDQGSSEKPTLTTNEPESVENKPSEEVQEEQISKADNNAGDNSSESESQNTQDSTVEKIDSEDQAKSNDNNAADSESNEVDKSENDKECEKSEVEETSIGEDSGDEVDLNSDFAQTNDINETVSRSVGAVMANDFEKNGISEEDSVKKIDNDKKDKNNSDESAGPVVDNIETNEEKESIKDETQEEDKSQSVDTTSKQTEGLKNGSVDDKNKEKTDLERKNEHKDEEKKNEEHKISRTPTDDHKSASRPYQSSSGDRNRYPQDSRWPGGDRGARNRDRYQDRGWSGGRHDSYNRGGGDRWRGGGWGGYHH